MSGSAKLDVTKWIDEEPGEDSGGKGDSIDDGWS